MSARAGFSKIAAGGGSAPTKPSKTAKVRELAIHVDTKTDATPDTVVVHVQCDKGQVEVTVKNPEQKTKQKIRRKRKSKKGAGAATGQTRDEKTGECSPLDGRENGNPSNRKTKGRNIKKPAGAGAKKSTGERQEGKKTPDSDGRENEKPMSAGKARGRTKKPAGAQKSAGEGQEGKKTSDSSKSGDGTETSTEAGAKPDETVSAGEASVPLAQRTELCIRSHDPPDDLDDEKLEEMLQSMPSLSRLSIDWRHDKRKLNIDIVSQHCRNLKEIDLSKFRLDVWSLEQLCAACPDLEVVKLPRKCGDEHVKVLSKLPRLRSLDLAHTQVTSRFLETFEQPLEKLSMAACLRLTIQDVVTAVHPTASNVLWNNLRELDLSCLAVGTGNLAVVLKRCPRLERLLVSAAGNVSEWLTQLGHCTELRELEFLPPLTPFGRKRTQILVKSSALVTLLSGCPKLKRLSLDNCKIVGDSTCLQYLGKCADLRELGLAELIVANGFNAHQLNPADLATGLSGCPLLDRLALVNIPHPIEQLVAPTGLPKLTYLNAHGTGLTNNSLRRLPQLFPRLSALDMSGCTSVSEDAVVSYLPRLKELRALDLTRTLKVPPSVVDKLKRKCPLLRINYG